MGLKIRLDSKGIHFIKPGVFGSSDDFYAYSEGYTLSSSTSLVGISTIMFSRWNDKKFKGFDSSQIKEIEKIYGYGLNGKYVELVDCVGVDGQEYEDTAEYKTAIAKLKAEWLQKEADKASKAATEALNAQAMAADAAAQAAKAYDRHQETANKAIYGAAVSAIGGAVPPPVAPLAIYVAVGGQQQGPFDMSGLSQMARQGSLTANSLVWKEGLAAWTPAIQVPELAPLFAAPQVPPVPPTMPPAL